jgi:hypothetical protein
MVSPGTNKLVSLLLVTLLCLAFAFGMELPGHKGTLSQDRPDAVDACVGPH